MKGPVRLSTVTALVVITLFSLGALGNEPEVKQVEHSGKSPGCIPVGGPRTMLQQGDTTWVQPYADTTYCPGDPNLGHGGEARGGPDGSETWCFEGGPGDTCATRPPWHTNCWTHGDLTAEPVEPGLNYWHVDTYRTDQQPFCGSYALWCGSDTAFTDPGYGNLWDCQAVLTLPDTYDWTAGCSLMFDLRYDTECKEDYFYVDFYDGSDWQTLAIFNATSDNPGPECGSPSGGNPDYWDNSDVDNLVNCDWQPRLIDSIPAFYCFLPGDTFPAESLSWHQLSPDSSPAGRFDHGIAYDSARDRVVIFGGIGGWETPYFDDTWEWDGLSWVERPASPRPLLRGGCQMAYDAERANTVLFGGMFRADTIYGDTWVWDGADWTELSPAHSPSPRFGHGMAYDSARQLVVLFGGHDSSGVVNDTWVWDGTDWTELSPANQPSPRYFMGGNGLAYDPVRDRVLVFGGSDRGIDFMGDTWEWDSTNWNEISPSTSPLQRDGHALAYSPDHGGIMLFAGNSNYSLQNDTWLWDGAEWTELATVFEPSRRHRHSMVYCPPNSRLLLFGGWDFGPEGFGDTWWLGEAFLTFRWRFVSDHAVSDEDGLHNTDGAAFIDNVWVVSDVDTFVDDFESGLANPAHWSFRYGPVGGEPETGIDAWHLVHDPDPPYEGGDGWERSTCLLDSSVVWRARPEGGYPAYAAWRNGWHYRLISPSVPIPADSSGTGCIVQYDRYLCITRETCDYADTKVRFYDGGFNKWGEWINIDGYVLQGGCRSWDFDLEEDVSHFYSSSADSVQFGWDFMDISNPFDPCRGKHLGSDYLIDNVSVGFYDARATLFAARQVDLFQDTFHDSLCGYNSYFDIYDPDTLGYYSGPPYTHSIPKQKQLRIDVTDKDRIREVRLYGSIDGGWSWQHLTLSVSVPDDPGNPEYGGEYNGTLCPTEFGLARWEKGTEVWYYLWCEDQDGTPGNIEHLPAQADPSHPEHTGRRKDYFTFSIMPMYPPTYTGVKILLIDGYGGDVHDYAECMASVDNVKLAEDIYGETLVEAGYAFDRYDINGAGSNIHIHPLMFDYDAVVWFTGPHLSEYLFDEEAQEAIRAYLGGGGKVVLCGDRLAYNMSEVGGDALGGEFLAGILGCTYLGEMEGQFTKPYVYLQTVVSVTLFGTPVPINPADLDSLVVYRECPELKDMSYVVTNTSPPPGYTVQPLLYVLNPDPIYDPADGAIYVEYQGVGQCCFVNFDLSGFVTHSGTACSGSVPPGLQEFAPGHYQGRADLMRFILEDIFGLPSSGTGQGGMGGAPRQTVYHWGLHQNRPNPASGGTDIRFEVAGTGDVSIKVYNAMGQLVRTLEDKLVEPGKYSVSWDGTNAAGCKVSSGVYFYRMESTGFLATKKMVLLD